jgi:hypothetical protein
MCCSSELTQPLPRARTPHQGRVVVQAWLASRGLIFAVALVLAVVQHRTLSNMVSNWDVQHFGILAAGGYLAEADGTLMAFFPGWPAILWVFDQLGVPIAISGVIISYRLLRRRSRGAVPVGWPLGGRRLAVRANRRLHRGALHRIAVLRLGVLGLGTGPCRSMASCHSAHRPRMHRTGIGAVPRWRTASHDHHQRESSRRPSCDAPP